MRPDLSSTLLYVMLAGWYIGHLGHRWALPRPMSKGSGTVNVTVHD